MADRSTAMAAATSTADTDTSTVTMPSRSYRQQQQQQQQHGLAVFLVLASLLLHRHVSAFTVVVGGIQRSRSRPATSSSSSALSASSASFGSWASQHDDWKQALHEILSQQHKQQIQPTAGTHTQQHDRLGFLFVSPYYAEHFQDIVRTANDRFRDSTAPQPRTTLVAILSEGVIGAGREHDESTMPAMSLFMGDLPRDATVDRFTVSTDLHDWKCVSNLVPGPADARPDSFLVFSDPYCSKLSATLHQLGDAIVAGGISARLRNRSIPTLAVNGDMLPIGSLLGLKLGGTLGLQTVLAQQGSHPLGEVYTVTSMRANAITELSSKPALDQLEKTVAENASDEDRKEIRDFGILCGVVPHEQNDDGDGGGRASTEESNGNGVTADRGAPVRSGPPTTSNSLDDSDVLVRQVTGFRPQSGAILVAGNVNIGDSVQFHARDHSLAADDVRLTFQRAKAARMLLGKQVAGDVMGILQISSVARGTSLFGEANVDHDNITGMMQEQTTCSIGGFFANGEIGPTGIQMGGGTDSERTSYIHGFASMAAVLCDFSAVDTDVGIVDDVGDKVGVLLTETTDDIGAGALLVGNNATECWE